MFDCHLHSRVSFDGRETGLDIAETALSRGIREICFTDHIDYQPDLEVQTMVFDPDAYHREYDGLEVSGLVINRGMEFGMTSDNAPLFREHLKHHSYDFVLGSVHFVDNLDVYFSPYWEGKTLWEAERRYLEETLACVSVHDDFDVLAHLSFLSKAPANASHLPLYYRDHREILDEILRTLVRKGKGLEMNTSGVDTCGGFLPTADFFRRFHELGGEIVTVGSDAHRCNRVGQYTFDACEILGGIFGYVCTFRNREPVFHKM